MHVPKIVSEETSIAEEYKLSDRSLIHMQALSHVVNTMHKDNNNYKICVSHLQEQPETTGQVTINYTTTICNVIKLYSI